jgi:uncharacterized protein YuzE
MAKINPKIIYNREEDIFYLSKKRPSRASIEIGDFIIDIDSQGFVSAIEILNASDNLGIEPNLLEKVEKASMNVTYKPDYIFVVLFIKFQDKDKEIRIPLSISLGHKKIQKEDFIFAG